MSPRARERVTTRESKDPVFQSHRGDQLSISRATFLQAQGTADEELKRKRSWPRKEARFFLDNFHSCLWFVPGSQAPLPCTMRFLQCSVHFNLGANARLQDNPPSYPRSLNLPVIDTLFFLPMVTLPTLMAKLVLAHTSWRCPWHVGKVPKLRNLPSSFFWNKPGIQGTFRFR